MKLNGMHWSYEEFKEVVNRKDAQEILKDRFHIVMGRMREFKVKHIGAGMYEVFKKSLTSLILGFCFIVLPHLFRYSISDNSSNYER